MIGSSPNFAQHGRMHDRNDGRWGMKDDDEHGPRIPDLTEEQEGKLRQMKLEFREKVKPLENQLNEKRAKLRTLTSEKEVDRKQVEILVEEMGAISTQIDKIEINHRLDVKSILTEEQQMHLERHEFNECGHRRH